MTNIANDLAVYLKEKTKKDETRNRIESPTRRKKKDSLHFFSLCNVLQPKRGGPSAMAMRNKFSSPPKRKIRRDVWMILCY